MLIVGYTRVFACLITAQTVIKCQTLPIANDLMVVLPIVIGQWIGRRRALQVTAYRAFFDFDGWAVNNCVGWCICYDVMNDNSISKNKTHLNEHRLNLHSTVNSVVLETPSPTTLSVEVQV